MGIPVVAWPPPSEVAELIVNGAIYRDWESVQVKHQANEMPPYSFRFTCSEGMPLSSDVWALRIKPGDSCQIRLAGIPAFSGYVYVRQVFYDAHRHHVELQGAASLAPSIASAIVPKQEMTDVTLEQALRKIIEPNTGLKVVIEGDGKLPTKKIEKVAIESGISAYHKADQLVRDHAPDQAINFTSNVNGDFVILVGKAQGSDSVTEGINILEARSVINNTNIEEKPYFLGQRPGNDQVRGPATASVPFLEGTFKAMGLPLPTVIINEGSTWSSQILQQRSNSESHWGADDQITVVVTVYGWLRPSGGLWYRGQTVIVNSPMLIMHGEPLILKSATFTQDNNGGTRTILDLRNEKAYGNQPVQM